MTTQNQTSIKDQIFDAALLLSADYGWGSDMIERLEEDYSPADILNFYPEKGIDLIHEFANRADQSMITAVNAAPDDMKIRDQIKLGVKTRLEYLAPYRQAFKQSIKYLSHPGRSLVAKRLTWQSADLLWYAAGDTATDYNHYTKRILLSGIFISTTLYWLKDTSENHHKTWSFLDRRINNVLKFGKMISKFKKTG